MRGAKITQAIIFDMDGVISDTQRLHSESEVTALAQFGITRNADDLALRYSGVPDAEMFADILAHHGVSHGHLAALEELKWQLLRKRIASGIPLVTGITDLVSCLNTVGYRLGIASGSPLSFIHEVLRHPSLSTFFEVAVSSDEVPHGKPAPDVFLEAAARLGVPAHSCLVVEDGLSGMTAAKRAGMRCIGLVKDITRSWPADRIVTALPEITPDMVQTLFEATRERRAKQTRDGVFS